MNKRWLYIGIGVIGVVVTLIIYFALRRKPPSPPPPTTTQSPGQEIILNQEARLDFATTDPSYTSVLYFNGENRRFERLDTAVVVPTAISDVTPVPILQVFWSPRKLQAVVVVENPVDGPAKPAFLYEPGIGGATTTWFVDFAAQRTVRLDSRIVNLAWSPDGERIAYYYPSDETTFLSIARPTGADFQNLIAIPDSLRGLLLGLHWTAPDEVTVVRPPVDADEQVPSEEDLMTLLFTASLSRRTIEKRPFQPDPADLLFLPDGTEILISAEQPTFTIRVGGGERRVEALVTSAKLLGTPDGNLLYFVDQTPSQKTARLLRLSLKDTKSRPERVATLAGTEFSQLLLTKSAAFVVSEGRLVKVPLP